MRDIPPDLAHRLRLHKQDHVLIGWEKLSANERMALISQLAGIDLEQIDTLFAERELGPTLPSSEHIKPVQMIGRDEIDTKTVRLGHEALARGEVAVLLVAGGQGSRLGFEKPKGMFPIGPVSNRSLFHIHADKVFALSRRYGKPVPFLIMTSPGTHDETEAFFKEHGYFGLDPATIYFFCQGTMPAVELETGRLLLEKRGVIFTSPNGHGGTLTALSETGLLDEMHERGVKHVFYFQVDNPLVNVADPAFVGKHIAVKSQASSKAIEKAFPEEKMGVLALIDGRCGIIEYSDMPDELLHASDTHGRLLHRAGSPAIHLFDVEFLKQITQGETRLPFHVARKKVPCLGIDGQPFNPTTENALKFEMFVFDALPMARQTLVVEALREEEFAPIKNAKGTDSPDTAKQLMCNLAGAWLQRAEVNVPFDDEGNVAIPIEISPRFALDADELAARVWKGRTINVPTYLD